MSEPAGVTVKFSDKTGKGFGGVEQLVSSRRRFQPFRCSDARDKMRMGSHAPC